MSVEDEPRVTINGTLLNQSQSLALRVAVTSFYSDLKEPNALGESDNGKTMATAYKNRLSEIIKIMQHTPSDF